MALLACVRSKPQALGIDQQSIQTLYTAERRQEIPRAAFPGLSPNAAPSLFCVHARLVVDQAIPPMTKEEEGHGLEAGVLNVSPPLPGTVLPALLCTSVRSVICCAHHQHLLVLACPLLQPQRQTLRERGCRAVHSPTPGSLDRQRTSGCSHPWQLSLSFMGTTLQQGGCRRQTAHLEWTLRRPDLLFFSSM